MNRNPLIAAVLSLVLPGAGHIYARQRSRGLLILVTALLLVGLFAWARPSTVLRLPNWMEIFLAATIVALWAWNVYDAWRTAQGKPLGIAQMFLIAAMFAYVLGWRVTQIDAAIYSHWHPDHVLGRRVWETMNDEWFHWPPQHTVTPIYLPQQVAADFRSRLGSWEQFEYLERFGVVRLVELRDGETIALNGVQITPFRVAQDYVYAFLLDDGARRVLIAPDELFGWQPPAFVRGVDLAALPMGLPELNPLTGERMIPADHPVLQSEATFAQTLEMVRQMQPRQTILTHIEEPAGLSYDDLLRLEGTLQADGAAIRFAYDTLLVEV